LLQVNIFVYLLYFYLLYYCDDNDITVKRRVIFIFKAAMDTSSK